MYLINLGGTQSGKVTLTVDGSTNLRLIVHLTFTSNPPHSTTMTDLTPALNELLSSRNSPSIPDKATRRPSTEPADEFLKEAYRIVRPSLTLHPNHH
jgi:hypothetical protein